MTTLKTFLFAALLLLCGAYASADNKSNLIYNTEEVNGLKVAETIYKSENGSLTNFMHYNYKYDEQQRMTESEAMKWDGNEWKKDLCIRYTYEGKSVTTSYYKWDKRKKEYLLVPGMTMTIDNPNQ